jgi:outer membrane protein TolC
MRDTPKIIRILVGLIFFSAHAFAVCAQEQDNPLETYPLSLKEATQLALRNNFDIQLTKYDTWIARADKQVAESIYDTMFEAEVEYRNDQSQRTSTILGTKTIDHDYNVGLSKKLPIGTTLSVDLENNRNFNNAVFATSPLTHDSTLGVTVEQDLGKNIFGVQDRGDVKITLKDIARAEYTTLRKIEESVREVQKAYWDLVLQMENVRIEEAMVTEAKKLYDLHQEKLKDGLVEIGEAIASQANYESRKNDLLLARNEVRAKNNALKLLLNIEENVDIVPSEVLNLPEVREELVPALQRAFASRQDYKKARNEIDAKNIALSLKKNNLWPEINLTATLERNGLGDHFKQSVTQITEEDNPDFFAGLAITYPLENNEAQGELKAAELEKAKSIVLLKLIERQIAVAIADQVRNCNIFRESAVNRQEVARLQSMKLEEEEKQFRYGRSDTDTLIRFQEDVVRAKSAVALALYRYHAALVELREAEGVLLKEYWEGEL